VIPNLKEPGSLDAWRRLEAAKRRLLFTLLGLGLPDRGLAFRFLKDESTAGQPKVLTGHAEGRITINIAEADDPHREQVRIEMGEAYRTLLGHFRHESGHYYWNLLIRDGDRAASFRERFGDERADDAEAGRRHYSTGPPADRATRFVSVYASMHPWEDFAETWAHHLHRTDTLETARAQGLGLKPRPAGAGRSRNPPTVLLREIDPESFEQLIGAWAPLTVTLNELNRSMGAPDPYPFVVHDRAAAKLRLVHETIEQARRSALAVD